MEEDKRMEPGRTVLYDRDIREPLFDYLEERFGKTRMFEEKRIGKSRADVVMLTSRYLTGLEIKSDADTYERLKRQVRDYDRFCDMNYVVVGRSHERHVEEHVPAHWGVLTVTADGTQILIEEKRSAAANPKIKRERQMTLLWRPELNHLLELNHLPRYKQKSKKFVQQKLMEKVDWEILKLQICEELFERDYTLWDDMMEEYAKS